MPGDTHHFVIHSGGKWHLVESLRNLLQARDKGDSDDGEEGGTKSSDGGQPSGKEPEVSATQQPSLSVAERLQIARLMVVAFLHSFLVYRVTEQPPRPERVFFYRAADEEACPRILSPYVSINLGHSSKSRGKLPLGTVSGLSKVVVNPVAELGLVLFQVGSGTALDYGDGGTVESEGFRQAVREARLRMREVAAGCGPDFAEAVALCMDKNKNVYGPAGEGDLRFMERLRVSLWDRDMATIP